MEPGEQHTRASVEAIPFGELQMQFTGEGDEALVGEAFGKLEQVIARIVTETNVEIAPLRLIHVTPYLDEVVRHWQRELGHPEHGVTALSEEEGAVGGRVFLWGDGESETTYGVLLLSDLVLRGVFMGLEEHTAIVAHEFGHFDDDLWRLRAFGHPLECPIPDARDWPSIRNYMAYMLWSECAANVVASVFTTDGQKAIGREHWVTMLKVRTGAIGEAITSFRSDADTWKLWEFGHQQLGVLLPQLGRTCGEMLHDESLCKALTETTTDTCGPWALVVEQALEHLLALVEISYDKERISEWSLEPLEQVVEAAFHACGLHPRKEGEGLYLDVPARNDHERVLLAIAQASGE